MSAAFSAVTPPSSAGRSLYAVRNAATASRASLKPHPSTQIQAPQSASCMTVPSSSSLGSHVHAVALIVHSSECSGSSATAVTAKAVNTIASVKTSASIRFLVFAIFSIFLSFCFRLKSWQLGRHGGGKPALAPLLCVPPFQAVCPCSLKSAAPRAGFTEVMKFFPLH